MLTLAQILAALEETADRFPVHTWRLDELSLWPLVRYEVASRNFELTARPTTVDPRPPFARRVQRWVKAGVHFPEPADVLVYSDGVSYLDLDGARYDRFADPVRALAAQRGLRTTVVTPHDRFVAGNGEATFVQPALDTVQALAAFASRARLDRAPALDAFPAAMDFLRARGAVHLPGVEVLARVARQIRVHARAATGLLRRVRPRVALLPSYIGTERFAFVFACRQQGIPSVDLQHGAAGETHWAYGGFGRAPPGGYEVLPSRFWCWSDADARAVERWAAGTHQALVGGIPLLHAWRANAVPGASAARERLDHRCPPGASQVAVVLSGYESPALLEAIVSGVEQTTHFFWFRTHPLRPRQGETIAELLRARSLSARADVELGSRVPLFSLLERVAAIVLELSSTAYEAAQFGVPSVVLSRSNAAVYDDLARRGLVVATEPSSLGRTLRALPARQGDTSDLDWTPAIDALLAPAGS